VSAAAENRGEWALKGIPGDWPTFAVKP